MNSPETGLARRRLLAIPLGYCAKGAWRLGLRLRSLLIRALEHEKERQQGFPFQIVFGEAGRSRRAAVRHVLLFKQLHRLERAAQANPRLAVLDLLDLCHELRDLGVLGT